MKQIKRRILLVTALLVLCHSVAFAPTPDEALDGYLYPDPNRRVYLDPGSNMLMATFEHFSKMGGTLCKETDTVLGADMFYMQMPEGFNPKVFRYHSNRWELQLREKSMGDHPSLDGGWCRYQFWNFEQAYDKERLPQRNRPNLQLYENSMQEQHDFYKQQEGERRVFMISNPDKVDGGDLNSFAFASDRPITSTEAQARYLGDPTPENKKIWHDRLLKESFLNGEMQFQKTKGKDMENCACKLLPVGQAVELETSPILFPQIRGGSSLPRTQGFGRFMGGFDGATSGSGVRGAALNTVLGDGAGDLAEIATDPQNRPYYAPTAIAARAVAQRVGLAAGGMTLLGNGTTGVMSGSKTGVAGPAVLITGAIILYDKIDEFMHEYEFCVMRQIDAKYLHEHVLNKWAQRKGRARAQGLPFNEPRPSDDRMSVPWQNWNNYWHYAGY